MAESLATPPFFDLMAPDLAAVRAEAVRLASWDLTPRQVADLELLMTGALAPLRGFLGRADAESVCERMRLADGTLWPVPFVLDVTEAFAGQVASGKRVALRHPEGMVLAVLAVSEVWRPDWEAMAQALGVPADGAGVAGAAGGSLGTAGHAGGAGAWAGALPVCLAGEVVGVELPPRHAFAALHATPAALAAQFGRMEWRCVAACDSEGFPSRAAIEGALAAAREAGAGLLVRVADPPRPIDDAERYARMRAHERVAARYAAGELLCAALPLVARAGRAREALLRGIVHRNCGCALYCLSAADAADAEVCGLLVRHGDEAGIAFVVPASAGNGDPLPAEAGTTNVCAPEFPTANAVAPEVGTPDECAPKTGRVIACAPPTGGAAGCVPESGRTRSEGGQGGPRSEAEGEYPEVAEERRRLCPPRSRQGFTVFFTGLSGSGKSTVAQALVAHLLERGGRRVTLLDGDLVRKHLSSELTFSREHRDLNILRIGFVAGEVTRHGGIAVCAPIAPYAAIRRRVRAEIERFGGFVEVHVATPLAVCEARDRKGLYAKARAGLVKHFTGIDDPYEAPERAEIVLDTAQTTPDESAAQVVAFLEKEGYLEG